MRSEGELRIGGRAVGVKHLDKVFWPKEGYAKGDLIDYYREVAGVLLPYLKDRPENLNRHPDGFEGPHFFQKDVEKHPEWVETERIRAETTGEEVEYVLCQDEATLVYLINLGCIELNPWGSRRKRLEKPDYLILDLDPEAVGFEAVVEVALEARRVLEELEVESYLKTSGGRGLHIYVPLGAKYGYDEVRGVARKLAERIQERLPELTSLEREPKNRQRRVYLDYLRNGFGQTAVSAYSVRPRPGATVSTPLEWGEVTKRLDPGRFTIRTTMKRLEQKGDLWKPVLGRGSDLDRVARRLGE